MTQDVITIMLCCWWDTKQQMTGLSFESA